MNKNDIILLDITDVTIEGNGVGRYEGMAVFVPKTAVGDRIKAKIVKVLKNYAFGIIDDIITPSPDRCDVQCGAFGKCGGCSFFHISYEAECRIKEKHVRDCFKRIAKLDAEFEPILPCENTSAYRNKAQYPVGLENGKAVCGFFAKRSHRIIPCGECMLHPKTFSKICDAVIEYVNDKKISVYDEKTGQGILRHIYLRRGNNSKEIMLCLVVTKDIKGLFDGLADRLKSFKNIKSIVINVNSKKTNVILGDKCRTLCGSDTITDIMCRNEIELSPLSFYQVNTLQAERLYGIAKEYADLKGGESIVDMYCGAGTIGLSMSDKAGSIIGVESVPEAVENARNNARRNGIENAEYICADAGKAAELLSRRRDRIDAVILDPPRKGCDELTLTSVAAMNPEKIVMISCNPSTCARDAAKLSELGYFPKKVRPVDLFPRTSHVECVVLMTRIGRSEQTL